MNSIVSNVRMGCFVIAFAATNFAMATDELWLTSLNVATPQEGFALAVKLSRLGVKTTQPDVAILKKERKHYAEKADSLIAASQVIAIHFQTIAAANNYWK